MSHPVYEHRQHGRLVVLLLGSSILLVAAMPFLVRDVAAVIICAAVGVVLALALAAMSSLTVRVDDEALEVRFGLPPLRRRVPLARLARAEAVRNPWWYGYGIHVTPHGWLWNVAGPHAVEVAFDDGRRFRVGTDDPAGLLAALARRGLVAEAGREPPGRRGG
jgi:hypothetical protein